MTILEYLLSDTLIQVIGQTMLHSLWQGILVAGILVACWPFLRKSTAANRYATFSVALLFLFGLVMSTFAYLYGAATGSGSMSILTDTAFFAATEGQRGVIVGQDASSGIFFPLLVTIWVAGISIMSIKLILEWVYLERLKIHSTPLDSTWQTKLDQLAEQLGLPKGIQLLQSKWVNSPVTIGMFRPIVLMPIGLVNGLHADQVACILAHELAHIRRHDFLVNILQSIVETLLFFNPMVWWLSRLIREERELCCDDIAAGVTGDKKQLAYTLAKLEEWRMEVPSLALGFNSKPNKAIERIRRLIGQEGHTKVVTKGWTSMVMLMALVTLLAFRPTDALESTEVVAEMDPVLSYHEEIRAVQEAALAQRAAASIVEEQLGQAEGALLELKLQEEREALLEAVVKADTIPPKTIKELEVKEKKLIEQLRSLKMALENSPERKEMEQLRTEYEVLHHKMEVQWHEKQAHLEKKYQEVESKYMEELREKERSLQKSPEMRQLEQLHREYEKKMIAMELKMKEKGNFEEDEKLQKEFQMQMIDLQNAFQERQQKLQQKVQTEMEEIQKIHQQFQGEEVMQEMQKIREAQQIEFQKLNNELGQKAHLRLAELQAKLQLEYQIKLQKLSLELEQVQRQLELQKHYREE
ncbi:MAG: M48 family metalloprotease [Saprospiraceae bacterium]|nr:M48 family metalloprotease [Saprospiraceae bacterium]